MRTIWVLVWVLLVPGASTHPLPQNSTVDVPQQFLHMGDGSSMEFEFPENTEGVMVISSRYRSSWSRPSRQSRRQTLRVRSLDPDVLSILNVSESGRSAPFRSFIISIRSGLAGTAPLLIQLLDIAGDSEPVLIEERRDYSVRVAPRDEDLQHFAHFSQNPVLFALLPLIFVNKCAFGCKVDVELLKGLLKRPLPLLLGVGGQFLVMPLYAYVVSQLASLPRTLSLGLVISCSAPGGGGGYLYSLLLGGDVTLAICMTLVSTVCATVAMPLSSALYGHLLGVHAALHVPFLKILGTLLFIAIPISIGMGVKLRLPALTQVLLGLIRPFSFLLIVGGIFMAYQMGSSILAAVKLRMILLGASVPVTGLLVGYILARLVGLPSAQRRTVAIEVGVQNSLLALAVMQLSFRRAEADYASQAPFMMALSSTCEMLLLVLVHHAHRCLCPPSKTQTQP